MSLTLFQASGSAVSCCPVELSSSVTQTVMFPRCPLTQMELISTVSTGRDVGVVIEKRMPEKVWSSLSLVVREEVRCGAA